MGENLHTDDSLAMVYLFIKEFEQSTKKLRASLEFETAPLQFLIQNKNPQQTAEALHSAQQLINNWEQQSNAKLSTPYDDTYPVQLLNVWDYPPIIFCKGNTNYSNIDGLNIDCGVSLVGSRTASETALKFTQEVANHLCNENITIISGLAQGIDETAHKTALSRQSRTVGIIGTGFGNYYPATSRKLQEAMETGYGNSMVITQFLPGTPPAKHTFPMRNGLMSAYGYASIIIEATEESGTRHQATQAIKHGRPLIITEQVATQTSWGNKYANDKTLDVQVVTTPFEAAQAAFDAIEAAHAPTNKPDLARLF